jgi:hypothetical protein
MHIGVGFDRIPVLNGVAVRISDVNRPNHGQIHISGTRVSR